MTFFHRAKSVSRNAWIRAALTGIAFGIFYGVWRRSIPGGLIGALVIGAAALTGTYFRLRSEQRRGRRRQ